MLKQTFQNERFEDLTAMMLKNEVFCGVTLCHSGYTAMITFENTFFFKRQSFLFTGQILIFWSFKMLYNSDDRISGLETFNFLNLPTVKFVKI